MTPNVLVRYMSLSFKSELDLNNKQRTLCSKHPGVARHAYNWGLEVCQKILEHNKDAGEGQKVDAPLTVECL